MTIISKIANLQHPQNFFDFQTDVNTSNWAKGIYLWEIWNGPQKEASGKWIKE